MRRRIAGQGWEQYCDGYLLAPINREGQFWFCKIKYSHEDIGKEIEAIRQDEYWMSPEQERYY